MNRSCCSSARRAALLALAAGAALIPFAARPHDAGSAPQLVAEALFLCDHLPPGGRDVNLSVFAARAERDPATGAAPLSVTPRAQVALALSDRLGVTADVGFATGGRAVDAPAASLKVLVRPPVPGRTGVAASLDVFGSTRAPGETEAGFGVGAIRSAGRFGLRASASVASGVASWTPHLQAGASAAAALGERWRVLAELVADVDRERAALSAGPAVKLAIDGATAVMAGVLFPAAPARAPTFAFQLTRSL